MPHDLMQKYRAPSLSSFKQVINAIPTINIWDPFPVLCPGKECTVWRDAHSMFFDGDHLSAYDNMKLLPDFTAYILPKLARKSCIGTEPTTIHTQRYAFNQSDIPCFFESISGVSSVEEWGRWSNENLAPAVRLKFTQSLPKGFTLEIKARVYGPNIGKPVKIVVGDEQQDALFKNQYTVTKIHFANTRNARDIVITPPHPQSPKDAGESIDERRMGIALVSMKIIAD